MAVSSTLSLLGLGDPLAGALVLAVAAVLLLLLLLGLLDPLVARIGLRNVARARSRTVILVLGLLVGSTIISSSLVVGTTVNTLVTHFVYEESGAVNEAVYAPGQLVSILGGTSFAPFPAALFQRFNDSASSIAGIQAVTPMIVGSLGVVDLTSGISVPGLTMVGVNASAAGPLGSFTTTTGTSLAGPQPGGVLLSTAAAKSLSAHAGDSLVGVGAAQDLNLTVLGVVQQDTRGGFLNGAGQGVLFLSLPDAQRLTGLEGLYNYLAVTNVGGMSASGVARTTTVWPELNRSLASALATLPPLANVPSVHNVLQAGLASAQSASSSLTTLFLVLGLFSIIAGAILIMGIFSMLAEERRGEIGVARAVGMRRGQLVRAYVFEGLAYASGSAALGTLLGVAVGYVMVYAFSSIVPSEFGNSFAVLSSFSYTPGDLIIAYAVGFLLTLGTISLTALAISRFNIVRAIRSLPEPSLARQIRLPLTVVSALGFLAGAFVLSYGFLPGTDLSYGYLGVGLLILAAGILAAAWTSVRVSLTAGGIALLVFFAVDPVRTALFGTDHTGTIFSFFLQGIFLLLGAVTVYVFNSDLVVRTLTGSFRGKARYVPAVRLAFSYPGQKRFRSGVTVSIFAMVLFVIVAVAAIGASIQSNVNSFVAEQSGGYNLVGFSTSPVPGITAYVEDHPALRGELRHVISFYSGAAVLTSAGSPPFSYSVAAAPGNVSALENFYQDNGFTFAATWHGMSAASVWQTLESNASVAVVDGSFVSGSFTLAPTHPLVSPGGTLSLSPVTGGSGRNVTVIGVLQESLVPIVLVNPGFIERTLGLNQSQFFLLQTVSEGDSLSVVQTLQTAFFPQGLQVLDLVGVLETSLQVILSFVSLLEVYATLGLLVGIAALGIVALRAVTERKGQVGLVRAIGFRQGMVLGAFLLEYSFLALVGMGIGTALGILLVSDLSSGGLGFFTLTIPWSNLAEILALAYALTLLAVIGPSWKASRLPPAEAVRYAE
jgi:putative ABC transport system permease protein